MPDTVNCWQRNPAKTETLPAMPLKRPLILAHYMPWFEAKPVSPQWGWHWTMNAFDPEQKQDGGKEHRRRIASHYYPVIGPYDSGDPVVIEYHLLLMKLAGIDGIIVDWYGLSSLYDYPLIHRNTGALFAAAAKIGLQIGICYEDQTIPKLVEAKRLPAEDRVKHARGEMDWLRRNWFREPAYLKIGGKPVLLSFGWSGLSEPEWEQVFADAPKSDLPLYLSQHRRRSAAAGTFDWPHPQSGLTGLDTYYSTIKNERVAMPVAFPRFHDIYKEAKVQESYGRIADDQGRTLTKTLERALKSGAALTQIATWNDWGEGTQIEPSAEFGFRDLETVQRLRRTLSGSGFRATPADLRLPHRLWRLRGQQQQAGKPPIKGELDTIARLLASGSVAAGRAALARIEAVAQPVI